MHKIISTGILMVAIATTVGVRADQGDLSPSKITSIHCTPKDYRNSLVEDINTSDDSWTWTETGGTGSAPVVFTVIDGRNLDPKSRDPLNMRAYYYPPDDQPEAHVYDTASHFYLTGTALYKQGKRPGVGAQWPAQIDRNLVTSATTDKLPFDAWCEFHYSAGNTAAK